MTAPVGLPLVVQSLPAIQTLANAEAVGAELQQNIMSPLIRKEIQEEKKKIEEVERKDPSVKVKKDKDEENAPQLEARSGRRHKDEGESGPGSPPDTETSNSSPLAGNLVDMKI